MTKKTDSSASVEADAQPICGIVRPIADMPGYPAKHWHEVHSLVAEAAAHVGYKLRLVSESDAAGIIMNDIVTNLHNDPIIIADVSGRNPNVMFELGMRLAFEKPVVIIADYDTPFSFDISSIKHLQYPRTLRYPDMVEFKQSVSAAITATMKASTPGSKGYLQQFGPIKVTELHESNVDLQSLARDVQDIKRSLQNSSETAWTRALSEKARAATSNALRSSVTAPKGINLKEVILKIPEELFQVFLSKAGGLKGLHSIEKWKDDLVIAYFSRDKYDVEVKRELQQIAVGTSGFFVTDESPELIVR